MPTVTGFNSSVQMADPFNWSGLLGSVAQGGNSTSWSSGGGQWVFSGTGFSGYSGGIPQNGTITGISYAGVVNITGISLSMSAFRNFVATGDLSGLLTTVFAGADTINGGPAGDALTGYGGTNLIFGNDGDDFLQSLGVADTLDGGNGQDRVILERTSAAGVTLALTGMNTAAGITLSDGTILRNLEQFAVTTGAGADTLRLDDPFTGINSFNGAGGVDRVVIDLTGSSESWSAGLGLVRQGLTSTILNLFNVEILEITGGSGSDELRGGTLADTLSGGDGDDLINGGGGADVIDGGAGTDRASFDLSGVTTAITLDLADLSTQAGVTFANGVVVRNIEGYEFVSGSGADTFTLSTLPGRRSMIDGGAGFDRLNADFSATSIAITPGVISWRNIESVHVTGGSGNDHLAGGNGGNILLGGAGDDEIYGAAGDLLDGGDGIDRVSVDLRSMTSDVVVTFSEFATPTGVTFADGTVVRNAERIELLLGSGNDTLDLRTGFSGDNNVFNGGAGFDTVIADFTGSSDRVDITPEFVISWGFTSVLIAGVERFVVTGGSGQDRLFGSETAVANDILNGGANNDTLGGFLGDDILNGGDGDDNIYMHSGADQMDGGAGNDRLDFRLDASQRSVSQTFQLSDFIGFNTAEGAHFASGAVARNMDTLWVELGDANDTVIVNTDLHVRTEIWAHGGFDVLQLDLSGETRAVAFTLMAPTQWSPIIFDAQPAHFWVGAVEQLVATLGSGADTVTGGDNNDTIDGGAGADYIEGGLGADSLDGGAGSDVLIGGAGNDAMIGGAGDDLLAGHAGADMIDGGEGRDVAVFGVTSDVATWSRNASGAIVVTSADGVDTITNTEVLRFADRDVLIDRPARTFSGNGTSDVLFRRADGIMASWEVTGTTINAASFLPTAGAEWTPLGTGDFNGDGRDDVLWQRDDGLVYTWHMNGGSVQSANAITGIADIWIFLGVGDFNGDLKDDIAWQRDDGIVFIWQMDGAAIASANAVTGLPGDWQIAGFGDFNSDGRDDFLWRNANTGQSVVWHMNGASIASTGATSEQAGLDWAIVGVGDTNGDGRDDIILQRESDGMISVWAMDGTNVLSATDVAAASPDQWTVRGIGDYNGDGRDDILWQHDNGLVYVWLMNGATIQSAGALSGIGGDWSII